MNSQATTAEVCASPNWKTISPRCNLYEDGQQFTMWFEMPGVEQSGLEMWVEKGVLYLNGKTRECCPKGEALRSEFSPVNYHARYRLSNAVNAEGIQAELKNGLLKVTLPKTEEVRPRKISVRTE